ncbi:MAG: uracil-DNA glycosylase [Acidobacteria bacterium]|nr:uracil-DNA glycosylase [Acidobacteriota bacterium]
MRPPEKTDRPAAGARKTRPRSVTPPAVLAAAASAANTNLFPEKSDALPVAEDLETIRVDLRNCKLCKLSSTRKNIVFGAGNPNADLMFVGEAPGADEDEQGLPFVGRAGQLLTKIIEAIDMRRDEVFICNILKCRPPGNRNPEVDEIAACEQFLFRQIASVKPKVICALGAPSAQTLLRTKEAISRLRGHLVDYRGAKLMATFHPAYLLRNPNEKRKVWEDMKTIRDYLASLT